MSDPATDSQFRILVIDDNPSIHEDFRKILGAQASAVSRLDDAEAALFGEAPAAIGRCHFRIDSAYQGKEALAMVEKAQADGDPYAMAFVDVRMPPGWDGVETLEHIWKAAPGLQAVICTAYSDYSWDDMTRRFGNTDSLLILKKPFETVEVLQLAHALTKKWLLTRQARLRMEDLDRMVRQRTDELLVSNQKLAAEVEERARMQDALIASEERFSKAFQASPCPMAILRCEDHHFLDANQSFLQLSGLSGDQLLQSSDRELHLWSKTTEQGEEPLSLEGRLRDQACTFRRSDGSLRQTSVSSEPLQLGSVPCLLVLAEDVTEHQKLEGQLRQAQKMEVIGRMAAGIAHEFNNILTVIQGDVGLLQTAVSNSVDDQALLEQIMMASQRAANLTSQLLAFSRKQVLQPRQLDLSVIIPRMQQMLARLIGERYRLDLHCEPNLPLILADEGGVEQIMTNLVLNARDALASGGVIHIRTSLAVISEEQAQANSDARPGKFACLSVADEGCGMNAHILARIFDPFFTTKEVGKGTGLGLSMIHGIVKQHDGWVGVVSEVGRGSTFNIYLPLIGERAPAPPEEEPATPPTSTGNGEIVFVVEDEIAVRELACAALRRRGYQVLKAADGPDALKVWDAHSGRVDLLLTDMVMPSGMSGGDLARALQTKHRDLKVIYTSGYSPEIMRQDSLVMRNVNFLPKPYDLPTLLRAVRLCLDGGNLSFSNLHSAERKLTAPAH